jgi:hypothetical protein
MKMDTKRSFPSPEPKDVRLRKEIIDSKNNRFKESVLPLSLP